MQHCLSVFYKMFVRENVLVSSTDIEIKKTSPTYVGGRISHTIDVVILGHFTFFSFLSKELEFESTLLHLELELCIL